MNKMNQAAKAEKVFRAMCYGGTNWIGDPFKSQPESNPKIQHLKIISCKASVKQVRNEKAEIVNPNVLQGYRIEVEIPNNKKALDELRHWLYQNLTFD